MKGFYTTSPRGKINDPILFHIQKMKLICTNGSSKSANGKFVREIEYTNALGNLDQEFFNILHLKDEEMNPVKTED